MTVKWPHKDIWSSQRTEKAMRSNVDQRYLRTKSYESSISSQLTSIPSQHQLHTQFQDARRSVSGSAGPRGWCHVREAFQATETRHHSETVNSRQDPELRDREQVWKHQEKIW